MKEDKREQKRILFMKFAEKYREQRQIKRRFKK